MKILNWLVNLFKKKDIKPDYCTGHCLNACTCGKFITTKEKDGIKITSSKTGKSIKVFTIDENKLNEFLKS